MKPGTEAGSDRLFRIGPVPVILSTGVVVQGVLSATEERRIEGLRSWTGSTQYLSDQYPESSGEQEIEEASSILIALQLGLGPDIQVNENLRISPQFVARANSGTLVPDSRWRLGMFGGSLDISWRL